MTHSAPISHHDQWVTHPKGQIFTRRWRVAECLNNKNPILLMHDSLGCVELWREFPAILCQITGRQVIAYDRLGFGRSDARDQQPSLDFVAEEARDFFPLVCEKLDVNRFVVLGHSVGGGMSIQCAAQWADRCEALVTLAAQAFPEDQTLEGVRKAREHFRIPAQLERLARYHGDKARWVVNAWTENWLHPGFATWSMIDALVQVHCPLLAIHGELDEYGSARHPELIGQHSNGPTRIEILRGAGHVLHREQPQVIAEMVSKLLAET